MALEDNIQVGLSLERHEVGDRELPRLWICVCPSPECNVMPREFIVPCLGPGSGIKAAESLGKCLGFQVGRVVGGGEGLADVLEGQGDNERKLSGRRGVVGDSGDYGIVCCDGGLKFVARTNVVVPALSRSARY